MGEVLSEHRTPIEISDALGLEVLLRLRAFVDREGRPAGLEEGQSLHAGGRASSNFLDRGEGPDKRDRESTTLLERVESRPDLTCAPQSCGGELPEDDRSAESPVREKKGKLTFSLERVRPGDSGVFFAEPHHPWQRGSNENFNGLVRRYVGKGTNLSAYSQQDLDRISLRINTMPRRLHEWDSAKDRYDAAVVALTA